MATEAELSYGDVISIPWGLDTVEGTVQEIYGPPMFRHVIVRLTPELSGYVVDEPTTVSMPLDIVRKVAPTG